MAASTLPDAPPERLDSRSASSRLRLDGVEWAALAGLIALAILPFAALAAKGRPLSGATGLLATDQMQYLGWIRDASSHGLVGNMWDLAPGDHAFLHPLIAISAATHAWLGIPIPLALQLWLPLAIALIFIGTRRYAIRLLPAGGARHAGMLLAMFAVMPACAIVAWTGLGGKQRQYTFDFISGEMWTGQYLWGYLFTAIAVFSMPLVFLGLERWREHGGAALLTGCSLGALFIMWLQPWQGGAVLAVVWGVELWRWIRRNERTKPSWLMLACVTVAGLAPAVYYFWLSKNDAGWKLAGQANSAGAQDLWSWPWWAIALTVLPLAVPAALAYRLPARSWQDVAVRIWPAAVLLVYLQPTGTFPYHSFQGLQVPLAILAVLGVRSVAPRLRPWIAVMLLGVMIIPGTIHKGGVLRHSVQSAGDPYWVFPGEVDALKSLDADPRRGGVLAPTYSSLLVPYRTGREAYVGPFSWTPDWEYRATSANALFEGRLTGAAGRRFIVSTHARWLFADCRPLALPALARTVAPLLARPPQRFGCATLYELKDRPDMARAAPPSA